jgi:Set1/Ash2 histone methyltransferase complex subunit ASH2
MTDVSTKDDRSEQAKDQAGRSKKQVRKRGSRNASNQQEITINKSQVDLVRLVRAEPKKADENPGRVVMSKVTKASQLVLSENCLSVTGHKGFRTACATHGVPGVGTYFCEVEMCSLGVSGHVRVGKHVGGEILRNLCSERLDLKQESAHNKYLHIHY